MLKITINPDLNIFHFDGTPERIVELEAFLNVTIQRKKPFRGNFWMSKHFAPSPEEAADGWGGWVVSQHFEIGDFIAVSGKTVRILKPKEFHQFFVIGEV